MTPDECAGTRPRDLLIAGIAAFAACLALGLLVVAGMVTSIDTTVDSTAAVLRPTPLGDVFRVWQVLGELVPFLALLWVPAAMLLLTGRRGAALVLALGAGATVISSLTKITFAVSRPAGGEVSNVIGESFAYPSGHTTRAAVALGLLALVAIREVAPLRRPSARSLAALVVGGVALMAVARVVSGEHWLSDVTGGALLGAAWVALTAWLWR